LRSIPLSQAFPILGLQYALIPVVSARLLKERMDPLQWCGIAFIAFGVALVGGS
jgi:undecaprenyl phosphate-alpha-L-ara4N flippase subunit ArnE